MIEQRTAADTPIGIPIRGYGVMLLIGIVTSVLLLMHEAHRMGIHPDTMLSLAFSMVVTGFLGARLFYVIEYWPRFAADSLVSTLGNILKLTDGGLVVYGSFIGALVAILAFVHLANSHFSRLSIYWPPA